MTATREPTSALDLPKPLILLTPGELGAIFQFGVGRGWDEFFRRYPQAKGYSSWSRISYGNDGRQALLYYEYHCGGLCGRGDLVLLARDDDDKWHVRQVLNFWIS